MEAEERPEVESVNQFVPGYLRQRVPDDWPKQEPPDTALQPVLGDGGAAVTAATAAAALRDPSEFLSCHACGNFVDDHRFMFCTACGVRLQPTSAAGLSKAWIADPPDHCMDQADALQEDAMPKCWNQDGNQFAEAALPTDLFGDDRFWNCRRGSPSGSTGALDASREPKNGLWVGPGGRHERGRQNTAPADKLGTTGNLSRLPIVPGGARQRSEGAVIVSATRPLSLRAEMTEE